LKRQYFKKRKERSTQTSSIHLGLSLLPFLVYLSCLDLSV
jgi:hypothetical protein